MSTIQDSNIKPLFATDDSATAAANQKTEDTQDRFLKLLVTQMQNQDPLNPLDNAEVTSQLAQLSTVNGIDKLNDTLQQLVSDFDAMRSLEATGMIGHGVLIPGTNLKLENNAAVAGVELPQPVDQLVVTIKDSAGVAIRNIDLGPQAEGVNTFSWDGIADSGTSAANGNYSFSMSAKQGGEDVPVTTLAFGSVNSVSTGEQGAVLDVGELGFAGLSDIKKIF